VAAVTLMRRNARFRWLSEEDGVAERKHYDEELEVAVRPQCRDDAACQGKLPWWGCVGTEWSCLVGRSASGAGARHGLGVIKVEQKRAPWRLIGWGRRATAARAHGGGMTDWV
jgi:hypothetical protein